MARIVPKKAGDAAGRALVEYIEEVAVLGDGDRSAAAGWKFVEEAETGALDGEDGDVAAAGVGDEEERVVLAEGDGALRAEWVGDAAAAATSVE